MALHLDLAPGDTLVIGDSKIRFERKTGQRARLVIESRDGVSRIRAEAPAPIDGTRTPVRPLLTKTKQPA